MQITKQKQVSIRLLPLDARPVAIKSIKSNLEYYIEKHSGIFNSEKQQLEVLVIPNLNWCFLRSLEGLEGIEYLQSFVGNSCK